MACEAVVSCPCVLVPKRRYHLGKLNGKLNGVRVSVPSGWSRWSHIWQPEQLLLRFRVPVAAPVVENSKAQNRRNVNALDTKLLLSLGVITCVGYRATQKRFIHRSKIRGWQTVRISCSRQLDRFLRDLYVLILGRLVKGIGRLGQLGTSVQRLV